MIAGRPGPNFDAIFRRGSTPARDFPRAGCLLALPAIGLYTAGNAPAQASSCGARGGRPGAFLRRICTHELHSPCWPVGYR